MTRPHELPASGSQENLPLLSSDCFSSRTVVVAPMAFAFKLTSPSSKQVPQAVGRGEHRAVWGGSMARRRPSVGAARKCGLTDQIFVTASRNQVMVVSVVMTATS